MITHDLKQPLVPIQGNAEMLSNPKMGQLNEMQTECVNEIQAQASLQLSMIENLISAQKLGAGSMKYDIEELSTKNILKECIKAHSPIMTDKHIEYFDSSTIDIKIIGDKRRLSESLTNIIQNAHDFVPENGKIEIGVTDGEKQVTFFCKDNGEGIPKDKQDRLFKKYGQVESTAARKFGGTGLGLAVSQQLVEGMGGKIWLESDVGKGTTFFFTIPKK
jgi:signal transduction histidine kinase